MSQADLKTIQDYLLANHLDGWLLYDFRGQNPVALHLAGLESSGSRRWFLWIPAQGTPRWLIHAIEASTFSQVNPAVAGPMQRYVGWKQLAEALMDLVVDPAGRPARRIAMEYSPLNAIPYVSKVDAGTLEFVREVTQAEVVSSADLVQMVQAVLSPAQVQSHRDAAAVCMAAKDGAFAFIGAKVRAGEPVSEYDVQQQILAHFAAAEMDPDHAPIVSVNANAADPHYAPDAQRHAPIRPGDMVLIDLWARPFARTTLGPNACFADMTWVGYCGERVPAKVAEIFATLAAARDRAVSFIQAGLDAGRPVFGYEVDDACRAVIEAAGYGEAFIHRTGHSLGSAVHFSGVNIDNLETQDRRQLIPGVLFTVEPGIYLPDFNFDESPVPKGLGLRTEINCLMHPDRVEVTTLPLQTEVLPLL